MQDTVRTQPDNAPWNAYDAPHLDLREFLQRAEAQGELTHIPGADWNLEIGAITESTSELIKEPPALLFDEIKGYAKGLRVLSIPTASRVRWTISSMRFCVVHPIFTRSGNGTPPTLE